MGIRIKAVQRKQTVGKYKDTYRYQMAVENYNSLSSSKVIEEASARSGINKSISNANRIAVIFFIIASIPPPQGGTNLFAGQKMLLQLYLPVKYLSTKKSQNLPLGADHNNSTNHRAQHLTTKWIYGIIDLFGM